MTTPITPVAGTSFPDQLVGPSDGEAANALSVNSVFQPVENGLNAALLLLKGGGIRRRVKCTDNTHLTIQPLGAILVTVAGIWTTLAHTVASTVSPATISGGLVASTRYYVYTWNNAGTVDFIANTTAPDVGLRYENGNTTREFVTTFITDVGGNVVTYDQNDNVYDYGELIPSGGGIDGNLVLDTTSGAASGTITLTTLAVPSGSSNATVYITVRGTAAALIHLNSPTQGIWQIETTATSVISSYYVPYSLANGNTIDYQAAANTEIGQINVKSFTY